MTVDTKSGVARPISRRTLAKGAAWSVPVIAAASNIPAYAASRWYVTFKSLGLACKTPGASCEKPTGVTKGYVIRVEVCTNIFDAVNITIGDATVSLGGETATPWEVKAVPQSVNCSGPGAPTIGSVPDADGDPDVVLIWGKATPTAGQTERCCVVDFGIEGEPNSANVSISGSAPYRWVATIDNPAPTPDEVIESLPGLLLQLSAQATPPCDKCEITDVPN